MSDYIYPTALIKQTENRIQKQMQGNGIDPKTINLAVKRQGLGEFTARTRHKIETVVETKSAQGKIQEGTLVSSGEMTARLQQAAESLQDAESTKSTIEGMIKSLPHEGFGAHKQTIPLPQGKQTFTEHTPCGCCGGKGQSPCNICHGQARIQCPLCHASGELNCMVCGGRGQTQSADGKPHLCPTCQGRGRNFCTQCQGQKFIPCHNCQSRGVVQCSTCSGSGASSKIATITAFAMTHAEIYLQELDQEPKRLASIVGGEKLANGGHIDISLTSPPKQKKRDAAWYENNPEPDTSGLYYLAKMPWAVAEISVAGENFNIAMIGKKGAVVETKPFMDLVFKKPRALLKQAAKGEGSVAGLLKEACLYNVSRETLGAVVSGKRKNAMQFLMKKYSVGLSQSAAKSMVMDAYNALKRVTRRPRYIGLAVGLMIAGALYYGWFGMNGRDLTATQDIKIRYAIDGSIGLVGIGLSVAIIKAAGFIALRSVMQEIGLANKQIPAAGKAGLYAAIGCVLLWGGFFLM